MDFWLRNLTSISFWVSQTHLVKPPMRTMVQLGTVVVLGVLAMTMSGVASQGIPLEALEINGVGPDAQVLQVGGTVGMMSSLTHTPIRPR